MTSKEFVISYRPTLRMAMVDYHGGEYTATFETLALSIDHFLDMGYVISDVRRLA